MVEERMSVAVPAATVEVADDDQLYHRLPDHPASGDSPPPRTSPEVELLMCSYSQPFSQNITWTELGAGILAMVLWLTVFASGLFVSTEAMRSEIANPATSTFVRLWDMVVVGISYTLTNVLYLSCLTAFLGCMMRRWQVGGLERTPRNASSIAASRIYVAAVLRGFFLYLMFISGFLLVSTEKTVTQTEFAQYIRIAGMSSIIGFIVGYDPNLLTRLMDRILSLANLPLERGGPPSAGRNGSELPLSAPSARPPQAR